MKEASKATERLHAQFENVADLCKMIKAAEEHFSQLQNQMDLIVKVIKEEVKRCAEIHKEINSVAMDR
jgi:hypothetical protein